MGHLGVEGFLPQSFETHDSASPEFRMNNAQHELYQRSPPLHDSWWHAAGSSQAASHR